MKHATMSEWDTLDALRKGKSIARYGDGELKLARGYGIKSQDLVASLQQRLAEIVKNDDPRYLVGLPRLDERGPKNDYWQTFMKKRDVQMLLTDTVYASALITRPDSAPWIDTTEYWDRVTMLWKDKHVALIWGGSRRSLTPDMLIGVRKLDVILAPPKHAWVDRENILADLDALEEKPEVVIMVLGPTATALVPDIVDRGIQALDLGHIGASMRNRHKEPKNFEAAFGFFWPNGAETYGKRYIKRAVDLDIAIRICRERRSVVQAGGHVGVWPKYLAANFKQVYTFEPDISNFHCLNKNVPEANVFRLQAALGYERKPVHLVLHPKNIGGHHLKGEGPIPQLRIDDLALPDCDLIVLDIEGSELDAILGAEATIKRCRPVLHLELRGHIEKYKRGTTEQLLNLLDGFGYRKAQDIAKDSIYVYNGPQDN